MNIIVNFVVKQDNKILMVQEGEGKAKGKWNFPAGHLDEGEDIFAGAIREAKEETGFDVKLTGLINLQNVVFNDRHILMVMFAAEIVGGALTIDGKEIMNVKFTDIAEIFKMTGNELRSADARKETIKRLIDEKVCSLDVMSNYNCKTR